MMKDKDLQADSALGHRQLVGAVGVAVVNSNNEASIKTTALIDIAEKISVLAEALTRIL